MANENEVLKTIKARRSVRKFTDKIPEKAVIDQICEAGTFAATGMGKQSPVILAVTNRQLRDKLSKVNQQIGGWQDGFDPFYGAPVVLVVLAKKDVATRVYDGSLVMGNLMLATESLGVNSIWMHRAKETFEMEEWKNWLKTLGIEGEYEGIGNCAIGYAAEPAPAPAPRKANYVVKVE